MHLIHFQTSLKVSSRMHLTVAAGAATDHFNMFILLVISTHYSDVIMGATMSQITNLSIVYSTVYSDADQRKHQSSASLAFVWGNSPVTGEFPTQMASNAENVSFWWRHHESLLSGLNSGTWGRRKRQWTCLSLVLVMVGGLFHLKPIAYTKTDSSTLTLLLALRARLFSSSLIVICWLLHKRSIGDDVSLIHTDDDEWRVIPSHQSITYRIVSAYICNICTPTEPLRPGSQKAFAGLIWWYFIIITEASMF